MLDRAAIEAIRKVHTLPTDHTTPYVWPEALAPNEVVEVCDTALQALAERRQLAEAIRDSVEWWRGAPIVALAERILKEAE